jgi:hypothetical protein
MRTLTLRVAKCDLIQALKTLGVIRRKRFSSTIPVWLNFDPTRDELTILEARRGVRAVVKAAGYWPPAGATLDMFALRRVAETMDGGEIELIIDAGAILIPTARGHVSLKLQPFGPESRRRR